LRSPLATIAGVFLQRNAFRGRSLLIAMLTFPLAFPGVVVGFMVILLAGRQGLIGQVAQWLTGENLVFAYSIAGRSLASICARTSGCSFRNIRAFSRPWPIRSSPNESQVPAFCTTPLSIA